MGKKIKSKNTSKEKKVYGFNNSSLQKIKKIKCAELPLNDR